MKLTQKELEVLIDNFLKEDSDLLREDYQKKVLLEQPSGVNTMMSWRYPGVGDECKLNIDEILTNKLGMEPKPAKNINDALSFILSRFIGLNSWMCDIVNIGLGVPRDTGDKEKEAVTLDLTRYFEEYTAQDWKSIYDRHKVKNAASFEKEFVDKILEFKNKAGLRTVTAYKDPTLNATFVKFLHNGTGALGKSSVFDLHKSKKLGIVEIEKNLKGQTKSEKNLTNDIIDSISSACVGSNSKEILKDLAKDLTDNKIKELFNNLKKL